MKKKRKKENDLPAFTDLFDPKLSAGIKDASTELF